MLTTVWVRRRRLWAYYFRIVDLRDVTGEHPSQLRSSLTSVDYEGQRKHMFMVVAGSHWSTIGYYCYDQVVGLQCRRQDARHLYKLAPPRRGLCSATMMERKKKQGAVSRVVAPVAAVDWVENKFSGKGAQEKWTVGWIFVLNTLKNPKITIVQKKDEGI